MARSISSVRLRRCGTDGPAVRVGGHHRAAVRQTHHDPRSRHPTGATRRHVDADSSSISRQEVPPLSALSPCGPAPPAFDPERRVGVRFHTGIHAAARPSHSAACAARPEVAGPAAPRPRCSAAPPPRRAAAARVHLSAPVRQGTDALPVLLHLPQEPLDAEQNAPAVRAAGAALRHAARRGL